MCVHYKLSREPFQMQPVFTGGENTTSATRILIHNHDNAQ